MADTETLVENQNETEVKQPAKLGKPERVANVGSSENIQVNTPPVENVVANAEGVIADKNTADTELGNKKNNTEKPTFTEDQLKAYFEEQGMKYEGIDKLKEKLNYNPAVEPTDEEKKKTADAKEKRAVDLFVKNGGKIEDYVSIKKLAEANVNELSIANAKLELKNAGFSDEKIEKIIKERYYQFDDTDIEFEDDDEEKEFKKKAKDYFSGKLNNRAATIQQQAKGVLDNLYQAIDSEDLEAKQEVAYSSNIDEYFKKMPRKLTFEIGEANGQKIEPVVFDVPESDVAKAQKLIKTPSDLNKILYNQDGSLNLNEIASLVTRNTYLESALKTLYHEGGNRQTEYFRKVFPATSGSQLGIGGAPTDILAKKEIAKFGKVQRVGRQ